MLFNFTDHPELAAYYQEVAEGKVNELSASYGVVRLSGEHKSCLNNLELVSVKNSPEIYGNYEIVLRCESGGVGEEVKLGSFNDSCMHTPYLTKWDFQLESTLELSALSA